MTIINKVGNISLFKIAIFASILTIIYIVLFGIANHNKERNQTSHERIVLINEEYSRIIEYKNNIQYVTPLYLKLFKFRIGQFESEINKLKDKINNSNNSADRSKDIEIEVLSFDKKLNELNEIYDKQSKSIAKSEQKS